MWKVDPTVVLQALLILVLVWESMEEYYRPNANSLQARYKKNMKVNRSPLIEFYKLALKGHVCYILLHPI